LEYLPYRKNDGTARRDADRHPYLAGHGYASVRVDIRGSGDSDGLLHDEYLPQELNDCVEVIAWLAAQPWCSGKVGMFGKSWGGFNALQVAALRPPALAAIITIASTDDRYADDVHYMGGCLLASQMLSWASYMFLYNARPPDPRFVGENWQTQWRERLETMTPWVNNWLRHQRRDAFWQHGSVCENYADIDIPVYVVGSWADGYTNAVPRLLAGLSGPRKGLIGPWGHNFPEDSRPGPSIGFLQESVRWWDRWLKGIENGIMAEPMVRIWLEDGQKPATDYAIRPGRWVAEAEWPSPNIIEQPLYLQALAHQDGGLLAAEPGPAGASPLSGDQNHGRDAGIWLAFGQGGEFPPDQRAEDGRAVSFTSAPALTNQPIIGQPRLALTLSSDQPLALLAARLCDVAPDGSSTLVSWGIFNLTHRDSHAAPAPLVPGKPFTFEGLLNMVGYTLPAGHRWRLSLAPAYWPHAWPSPVPAALTLQTGATARLYLPGRSPGPLDETLVPFGPPEGAAPLAVRVERPAGLTVHNKVDIVTGQLTRTETADDGATYFPAADLRYDEYNQNIATIQPADPLSATTRCLRQCRLERPGQFAITIDCDSRMWCDADNFYTRDQIIITLDGQPFFERRWDDQIARDLV
ncbi:MAG: CocE/NonD family hydrolase, partial [Anaerolineales bacterium]|nr:CocE/NonD family hydrolase [Anaerolineales bacterium]